MALTSRAESVWPRPACAPLASRMCTARHRMASSQVDVSLSNRPSRSDDFWSDRNSPSAAARSARDSYGSRCARECTRRGSEKGHEKYQSWLITSWLPSDAHYWRRSLPGASLLRTVSIALRPSQGHEQDVQPYGHLNQSIIFLYFWIK